MILTASRVKAGDNTVRKEDSGGSSRADREICLSEGSVKAVETTRSGERDVFADVVISVKRLMDLLEGEVGGEVRPEIQKVLRLVGERGVGAVFRVSDEVPELTN